MQRVRGLCMHIGFPVPATWLRWTIPPVSPAKVSPVNGLRPDSPYDAYRLLVLDRFVRPHLFQASQAECRGFDSLRPLQSTLRPQYARDQNAGEGDLGRRAGTLRRSIAEDTRNGRTKHGPKRQPRG